MPGPLIEEWLLIARMVIYFFVRRITITGAQFLPRLYPQALRSCNRFLKTGTSSGGVAVLVANYPTAYTINEATSPPTVQKKLNR